VDRDLLRECDSTRAGMAPIPMGKNTFASPDESVSSNNPKIEARDKGAIDRRLCQAWSCGMRRELRNMCKASYLLISPEYKQLSRMQTRKVRFRP
jgi:hypothetical protein